MCFLPLPYRVLFMRDLMLPYPIRITYKLYVNSIYLLCERAYSRRQEQRGRLSNQAMALSFHFSHNLLRANILRNDQMKYDSTAQ